MTMTDLDRCNAMTALRTAQARLFALVATRPPVEVLALAASEADGARAAAPGFAAEQEARIAAGDARLARRRYATGGDWLGAVQSSLVHAQMARAVAPAYLLHAAAAALPVARRQLAALGDPEESERERLAEDLTLWAEQDAAVAHDAEVATGTSYGVPLSHSGICCTAVRDDAARNEYAFASTLSVEQLQRRHESERTRRPVSRDVTDPLLGDVCAAARVDAELRAAESGAIPADVRRAGIDAESWELYRAHYGQAPDVAMRDRLSRRLAHLRGEARP